MLILRIKRDYCGTFRLTVGGKVSKLMFELGGFIALMLISTACYARKAINTKIKISFNNR